MKKEKNIIKVQRYESPCGLLLLGSFGDKLCLCDWQVEKHRDHVDRRLKRMLCSEFEVGTSEVIEKAARNSTSFLPESVKSLMCRFSLLVRTFKKQYGTNCWKYLLERQFLMVKWPSVSVCPKQSVRLPMPMVQTPYRYSLLATG